MFGHKKLGGIGDIVSNKLKDISPKYNNGHRVNVIAQRLGYLVRSGNPDAIDSIAPMAFGNLALDLILQGDSGKLVILKNGRYGSKEIEITSKKKLVNVEKIMIPRDFVRVIRVLIQDRCLLWRVNKSLI